jgi:ATP-dependent DNA helicase Rep
VEGLRHPLPRQPPGQAVRRRCASQHPYKVSGGTSFFDRAEIKDLCAWFRLWINNDDDPAFLRAIGTPGAASATPRWASWGVLRQHKLSDVAHCSATCCRSRAAKAHESLLEFGRYINDLEYRARHTLGAEQPRFMLDWLKEIGYEQYLYDSETANRGRRALEQCAGVLRLDGPARRRPDRDAAGTTTQTEVKSLLEVAQNIALLSTISEREKEQDMVILSTLHASKGLDGRM